MDNFSHGRQSRAAKAALTLVIGGATALATTIALAAPAAPASSKPAIAAGERGALYLKSSEAGKAVLHADNLAPGESRRGTVTIRNEGSSPASLALSRCGLRDVRGPNGGLLSSRLTVKVAEVGSRGREPLYAGRLRGFGRVTLSSLRPNEARTYAITVTFPDGGHPTSAVSGDNAFQGASTAIDLCWPAKG